MKFEKNVSFKKRYPDFPETWVGVALESSGDTSDVDQSLLFPRQKKIVFVICVELTSYLV